MHQLTKWTDFMSKIVLLGAPGAGKGTQGEVLCKTLEIPKISTGDLLREAVAKQTPIGIKVQSLMGTGQLIADEIVMDILTERLAQPDCAKGYLLDGFPRTVEQVQMLFNAGIQVDAVLELEVPDQVIVDRMSGRRVHMTSGRTYHVTLKPPLTPDVDDVTGEALTIRADDAPEIVLKRLGIYHEQIRSIVEFYAGLPAEQRPLIRSIDGDMPLDIVQGAIRAALGM